MNLLNKIFKTREEPIRSYNDFWNWFLQNEKSFYKVVNGQGNIETQFLDKLSPKLDQLREGFWFLTGMLDDNTVELVMTAEGDIKNIVFVEELVAAAPNIEGWKFTALKPALDVADVSIEMAGFNFSEQNMNFYSNEDADFPDEIDITIVHDEFSEENESVITNGVFIFLDNYLGELDFATTIDNLSVTGRKQAEKELIPIDKLKDFLAWRQKEFIEKYEGLRHTIENDSYSMLEARLENGDPLIAVVNTDLLEWDRKASHPWVLTVEIPYDGKNNNGMPDEAEYKRLDEAEQSLSEKLQAADGYLNIGRQTAQNLREIFFACKDFRKPSKVLDEMKNEFAGKMKISFDISKDKYWRTMDRYSS